MTSSSPKPESWHLDKKVPIALIVMILAQTFAAGMITAAMNGRMSNLEDRASKMESWKDGTQNKLDVMNVTLGRVDERLQGQGETLREIKNALQK